MGFVRDGELELVRRDGVLLTVLATTTAVRDNAGAVVAYRGILRDVTHQRKLEQGLLQAQKLEAVGRLAGGVAHDFNNLLTAILGYSELLSVRASDAEVRRHAQAISEAAQRGAELTSQLLAFGRRQVLQPVVFDLNSVVRGMQELLRRLIPEDVGIVLELEHDLAAIEADRTQIEQVIVNLAINARDAMPAGGRLILGTGRFEVSDTLGPTVAPLRPGRYTRLTVRDTGVGIEDSVRDHIFEPFFTTKEPGCGTGLGLATVHAAVHQNGGHVEVATELGVGTRFDIFLPVAAGGLAAVRPALRASTPPRGSERVLLVEDDPGVQQALQHSLEERGFTVLVACDGVAGLELARREGARLDLLLTDVVMPRMNGIELAHRLRQELPHLRVLLISGYAKDQEQMVLESAAGARCESLPKPFTPEVLVTAVRQLLDA